MVFPRRQQGYRRSGESIAEFKNRRYIRILVYAITMYEHVMTSQTQNTKGAASVLEWNNLLGEILPSQGEWSEEEYLVLTDHRTRLVEFTDGSYLPGDAAGSPLLPEFSVPVVSIFEAR
jgi:hypothetical protein